MKPSENAIVARIAASRHKRSRSYGLRLGIGDDAALLAPRPGYETILTCDWFLEGIHFLRHKHLPDSIGWKCLARALSDVAAMGGAPRCFLLSLALPDALTGRWLTHFLAGLRRASRRFSCPLAGGDTTRRREILINITVLGDAPIGRAVLRSGAKPGDLLYVSGRLGEADLGLQLLRRSNLRVRSNDPIVRKHLYPEPRLQLGQFLAKHGLASAMMDLSDGLSSDLPRLCAASRVGARVDAAHLPLARLPQSAAAKHQPASRLLDLALNGGDDYELLFTVPPRFARRIPASYRGLPLTCIGEITRTRRLLLNQKGHTETLPSRGWDPFRRG